MLQQGFIVAEETILNTTGGIEVAHICNIPVSLGDQIVGQLVGPVKIIRHHGVDIGMLIIKIEKHFGQFHGLYKLNIWLAHLAQENEAVHLTVVIDTWQIKLFFVFAMEDVKDAVVAVWLQCP
ncbi:hypothetical protein D1872_246090 [compost metagenome]